MLDIAIMGIFKTAKTQVIKRQINETLCVYSTKSCGIMCAKSNFKHIPQLTEIFQSFNSSFKFALKHVMFLVNVHRSNHSTAELAH